MKIFYYLLLICSLFKPFESSSQNLNTGDIAFIGFHFDNLDSFTFITLTDISGGEIIYFTEHSWSYSFNTWHNNVADAHYSWTAPVAGVDIGTIITITETSSSSSLLTATLGTMDKKTAGDFSLSQAGDALFAYQSSTGATTNCR